MKPAPGWSDDLTWIAGLAVGDVLLAYAIALLPLPAIGVTAH
jgi:hypothetical protein